MVQIPSQKGQRVQVQGQSLVLQNPSAAPSEAFGGGRGWTAGAQALGQASDQLGAVARQMQNEDNEAEARELDLRFNEALRGVTYGDPENGVEGYYSTQGKSALDQYGASEEAINQALAETLESASNDVVRRMATGALEDRRQRALNDMTRHAQSERQGYLDGLNEAREAQAFSDAALQWNDDSTIYRSLGIIEGEVEDWATRNGVSSELAGVRLAQRQSVAVKGAFDAALANGNTVRANRILSRFSEVLDGPTKASMEKDVLQDTQTAEAQTLAGSALSKFPSDPAAARAYIRSVASGEMEDDAIADFNRRVAEARGDYQFARTVQADQRQLETQARVEANHQYTLKQRQEKEQLETASRTWGSWLYAEGATTPRTVQQFRKENPEVFDMLSRAGRVEALQREARNVAEGQLFANATDGQTLAEIKSMNVAERSRLDPQQYRQQLTQTEYNQAVASVNAAKEELKRLSENPAPYNQGRAAIERLLPRSYGSSPTDKKRSANEARVVEAADTLLREWISEQLASGVRPSEPDIAREAARLTLQVQSDPEGLGIFNSDNASFEGLAAQARDMSPAQRNAARVAYDNVPAVIRDQINGIAQARGVVVSDELMEELAGALAMGDQARFRSLIENAGRGR